MTKRGLVILLVLIVIVGGAIGGIIMFLNQQEAVQQTAEPSPAVTLSETGGYPAEGARWTVTVGFFTEEGLTGFVAG